MRTELFVTTLIDTWIPGERVVDRAGCWGTPPRRVAGSSRTDALRTCQGAHSRPEYERVSLPLDSRSPARAAGRPGGAS